MKAAEDDEQAMEWEVLYTKVRAALQQFGNDDYLGRADYHVLDDNYGFRTINVALHKLEMLRTSIIDLLQELLRDHPDWEILIAVDIPEKENLWPNMGLIIRIDEVVDELQRNYLPNEFRDLSFGRQRGPAKE